MWSEEEYHIYGLDPAGPSPSYDLMLEKSIYPDDTAMLHETFTCYAFCMPLWQTSAILFLIIFFRQMAYHDSLTNLPNRKLFSDRLGIALASAHRNQKSIAIGMLDLDNFKTVNDTLGHAVGDLLLKAVAARLIELLRTSDTIARFGGDEFVLIIHELNGIEDAIHVAQKIIESFRRPFLISTHQLVVTMSIGIAVYPQDGTDEMILLRNADQAMYQAKQKGRNQYSIYKKG